METWNPNSPLEEKPRNKEVRIIIGEGFPYLDLEMYCGEDDLRFRVHLKPNQVFKYLNEGSFHINACFRAIHNGVIQHLTILTSPTLENKNQTLDKLYPHHVRALENDKLPTPNIYPTLEESIWNLEAKNVVIESTNDSSPKEQLQKSIGRLVIKREQPISASESVTFGESLSV